MKDVYCFFCLLVFSSTEPDPKATNMIYGVFTIVRDWTCNAEIELPAAPPGGHNPKGKEEQHLVRCDSWMHY